MRNILTASDGLVLTDGTTYGTKIYLAEGKSEKEFYEITKEDYEKMLEEESEEAAGNV